MKKFARILCLALVAVTLVTLLASCSGGIENGTYRSTEVAGSYTQYVFEGKNYTMESYALGAKISTVSGTYQVNGDEITFTTEVDGESKSSTLAFEQKDGAVVIGIVTYTKK